MLQRYPQVKAIGLWDHTGSTPLCDYRFSRTPALVEAVTGAGKAAEVQSHLRAGH